MLSAFQLRATFVIWFMCAFLFSVSETATGQTCAPPPAGLVSFWPGDSTANDLQGTNHGALEGGTTFSPGHVGPAFSFGGVSGSDVAIPSINAGLAFTVELWVYPTRFAGFEHLVSNAYTSANYGALYFVGGSIQYWQGNMPSAFIGTSGIPLNTWTHVALTYDGNAGPGNRFARLYINGVLAATSADHTETFNNALKFGFAVTATDNYFKGLLDEVSLYNQALSATDIQSIFNAGSAGKCVAPLLTINDAAVVEGNSGTTPATFTVNAVRHANTVTVDYATSDGTTAPGDYQMTSGSFTFPPSSTSATITVPLNGDTTFEVDETFFVNLANATNATIGKAQGFGTIINDDCFTPPANMAAWWPAENNADDIQGGNNGTLENGVTFAAGEVGQAFSFNGTNSVLTPTINIGAAFTVELWIFPTSALAFQHLVSNSYVSASYGALYYNFDHLEYYQGGSSQIISGAVPLNAWTHVALTYDGSVDRLYLNGSLVATSGVHSENFNNALRFGYSVGPSDNRFQGNLDEITLYSRALSALEVQSLYSTHNIGKCSIMPNMFINDVTMTEGNSGTTNAVFTVSLSHPIGSQVTVDYQTADGSATSPSDYQSQSGMLTIPANSPSGTITVPVNGDTTSELDENFFVNLSNATNAVIAKSQGIGTIINDDCFPPPAGLVAWWIAEGSANDVQGNNNGTLENGAAFAAGEVGQAFSFDGADDSVVLPTVSAGTSFTLELWTFPTSNLSFQHLVSNDSNSGNYGALYFSSDHVVYYQAGSPRVTSATLPFNTWTHVALTYDGSVDRLYINGNLVDTSATHAEVFNNALRFGYSAQPQDKHFQGRLDEISLYNRALTNTEVLSIYDTHTTGKCLGGSWTGATSADWHNPGNWTSGMVPDANTDVTISTNVNNNPVISSANASVKSLTLTSGRTITVGAGRILTVNDTLNNGGVIAGAGAVACSGASVINAGTLSVANFNFTRAGGQTLSGGGSFFSNTATVLSGATLTSVSDHQMSTLVIQSGATMDITSRVLGLSGSLANGGTLTVAGSAIVANGTAAQTLTTPSYNSLTIDNSSGVNLGSDATLGGTLTLTTDLSTGGFTLTMPNSAGSTGSGDVIGNLKRTGPGNVPLSFGNPFNTIAITGGTAPVDVTISLAKASPQDFGNSVRRTYTITPNGGNGYSATLRLHYRDAELNNNSEGTLQLWRKNGASWTAQGATSRDATDNWVEVTNVPQFSSWTLAGPSGPTAAPAIIAGRVTTAGGEPVGGVLMHLSGVQSARTISDNSGYYSFPNVETAGFYTVTPLLANYQFSPASRSFSLLGNKTDAVFTAVADTGITANPLDTPEFFVRQHYLDFLNRESDQEGLGYWAGELRDCNNEQGCVQARRTAVSDAFFYEPEYQQTGSYVFRLYRAAFGNNQPMANGDPSDQSEAKKLPRYDLFAADRARVVGGVSLTQSQLQLANSFVERSEFLQRYPTGLAGPEFVDAMLATIREASGVDLSEQRQALVELFNAGGRGAVIYRLADENATANPINNRAFIDAEYNRALVYAQYAGYLRRDADLAGFLFWLEQANRAPVRDTGKQHAMVCSFITSAEYQLRFSSLVTHTNAECSH